MTGLGRLCDAVNIAREIVKANPGFVVPASTPPVYVNPELRTIVEKRMREAHGCASYSIAMRRFPSGQSSSRGHLIRFRTRAEINVSDQCNDCWTRFVVCKELCHLIADTEDQYLSGSLRAQLAVANRSVFQPPLHQNEQMDSETFAMHLAACVLLPWDMRSEWELMRKNGLSNYKIAQRFKLPEAILQAFLTDQYQELWREANETYNGFYAVP